MSDRYMIATAATHPVDPGIAADHRGRKTCICGLTGRPGDGGNA